MATGTVKSYLFNLPFNQYAYNGCGLTARMYVRSVRKRSQFPILLLSDTNTIHFKTMYYAHFFVANVLRSFSALKFAGQMFID